MQESLQIVMQFAQLGLLAGIFTKIGRFGALIDVHDKRLDKLEEKEV